MTKKIVIQAGERYGRYTLVERAASRKGATYWVCQCDCGTVKEVQLSHLRNGTTQSCGCYRDEVKGQQSLKHGHWTNGKASLTYVSWQDMKLRVLSPNDVAYHNYGGKGVTICDRWLESFEAFLEDLGERPSKKHTLDRIDPNGNYEPGNVKWSTILEQNRNKRNVFLIEVDGVVHRGTTLAAKALGASPGGLKCVIFHGKSTINGRSFKVLGRVGDAGMKDAA